VIHNPPALQTLPSAEPLATTIPDPVSTDPITVTLNRADLLDLTFPLLYTPEIAALLPLNPIYLPLVIKEAS
jgi:hypothetical protein